MLMLNCFQRIGVERFYWGDLQLAFVKVVVTGCLLSLIMACQDYDLNSSDPPKLRKKHQDKDIHLAVVWKGANGSFYEGAKLAQEEINRAGGVEGRLINLKYFDEQKVLERSRGDRALYEGRHRNAIQIAANDLAKQIIKDRSIDAVLGHTGESKMALSAMLSYSKKDLLFMSGSTTDSKVRWASEGNYFQMMPKNIELVRKLAEEIVRQKWDSVYLVYETSSQNEHLAELLKKELATRPVRLLGSRAIMPKLGSDDSSSRAMDKSINGLRKAGIDAVVLLVSPELAAKIIPHARDLGVVQPFIGSSTLDSEVVLEAVGNRGLDIFTASVYKDEGFLAERFSRRYERKYQKKQPDDWAAMGYDSVKLYAEAVACADSKQTRAVASVLRYKLPLWYGLVGAYSFRGAVNVKMKYHTKVLRKLKDGSYGFVLFVDPEKESRG